MRHMALITFGRSGSTMLQCALNQSPNVILRGENFNVPFGAYLTWAAARKARNFISDTKSPGQAWFGASGIPVERVLALQRELLTDCILRPKPDTELIGWKEIRHVPSGGIDKERLLPCDFHELVEYLIFLDRVFPGIRCLINIRAPATACRSSWWAADPDASRRLLSVAAEWLAALPEALQRRLNRPAAFVVRYEDWALDPLSLQSAWNFLGVPWEPEPIRALFARKINAS